MCAFFDKFKKQKEPLNQPEKIQPIAAVVNPDTALGIEDKPEIKDVKEEQYDTYQDDEETEEGSPNIIGEKNEEDEEEEIDEVEDEEIGGEKELERLKEKVKETEERIEMEKQIKLRDKEIKEAEKLREQRFGKGEEEIQQSQPQYIPILLTEAEFMKEILKRIEGIELWAKELTLHLKSKGLV